MKIYELKTKYNLIKSKIGRALHILNSPPRAYVLVEHRNAGGELLYHNAAALIDQGEESIIKSYFQAVANSTPSAFKVELATDATIAETATTYTKVAGTGYAEVSVARDGTDWTAAFSGGDWRVTSKNCVFTAGGTWTGATKVVLEAVLNSVDTIVAYADLSATRTLFNGDTLTCTVICSLA